MSPWNLMPATAADVATIAELVLGCAPSCLPLEEPEIQARLNDFRVLRDEQGRIVGCAALKPLRDLRFEIGSVAVSREHRGAGLGRRLVEGLVKEVRSLRRTLVCVTRCPGFFARLGFQLLGPDPVLNKPGVPPAPDLPPRVAMALDSPPTHYRMAA